MVGLSRSLRSPAVYTDHSPGRRSAAISEQQFYSRIDTFNGDRQAYFKTLTRAINDAIAHDWEDAGIDRLHMRIPFTENYLLYVASYVYPRLYRKYEYMNYRKAVERGVGLCSQCAIIEVEVLKRMGIRAHVVSLHEHVVAEGEVDPTTHEWWLLDPDFGVTVPHDVATIAADTSLIRPYYIAGGRDPELVSRLQAIFANQPRTVFEGDGATPYSPTKKMIEQLSYVFIWIIPVVLMLPLAVQIYRRRRPAAGG